MKSAVLAVLAASPLLAQPTCTQSISSMTDQATEIVADLSMAKKYFLDSPDPSIVSNYQTRTDSLKAHVDKKLASFTKQRTAEYKNIVCALTESKTCSNHSGGGLVTCPAQLAVPSDYTIIESTIQHTMNGALKKYTRSGTNVFDFAAGRSSKGDATAYVTVSGRYSDAYVKRHVDDELAILTKSLNSLAIPTAN